MTSRAFLAGVAAVLITCSACVTRVPAATAEVPDLATAERLLDRPVSSTRDRAIQRWASHAPLPDLLYVLRRPREDLGTLESRLLARALEITPPGRAALMRRLTLRLARADPGHARRLVGTLVADRVPLAAHAASSPFRVAALLPERGEYQGYARAVRAGLEAGFALAAGGGHPAIELELYGTGSDEPARVAAALDSAASRAAAVVGELLSVPTLALASAARIANVPVISPTATDEAIGEVGPMVFQIGPSALDRGAALARALVDPGRPARLGVLLSSEAAGGGLAGGFVAAAKALGSEVVWQETYASGNLNFAPLTQSLIEKKVDVLLWDGEPREAEALLRRLAQDRISLRVGGGEGLSPDRFHAEARVLLEGVRFVADDWRLDPAAQAALDSVLRAGGASDPSQLSLVVRGYLAARFIAAAVAEGALCPEEVTAALARHLRGGSPAPARGFLDCETIGASIPVLTVTRGRVSPIQ